MLGVRAYATERPQRWRSRFPSRRAQPDFVMVLSARTGLFRHMLPIPPQLPALHRRRIKVLVEQCHEPLLRMWRKLAEMRHQRGNADVEKRRHGDSMRGRKRCLHPSLHRRRFHRTMSDCGGVNHRDHHREAPAPPATQIPGPAPARSRRSRWYAPAPVFAWPNASVY